MLESAWRTHVAPRWANVPIADIDLLAVEGWIAQMGSTGAGATTALRAYGVLSRILADAVKGKQLAVNPTRGVENLPRKTARRHVYLSANDVHQLADESGEHGALVLLLAYRGLRWGEAVALRVHDVEFPKRRLVVSQNAVQLGAHHAVGTTKGRRSRSVPVPAFVLDELSRQCDGKGSRRSGVPRTGRRIPATAPVDIRVVRHSSQAGQGAGDHSARPSSHLCLAGNQRRGERAGPAADARAHLGEGHAGYVRRPVRRRPGRGRGRCGPCKKVATANALRNKRERLLASGLPDDNRHRTRARRFGGQYQPIDRQAVFDRDAWCCGICKQAVDKDLSWPDPMSVSLDHIVPMSQGGDHSYENVQCAHLVCNQTKSVPFKEPVRDDHV